MGNQIICCRQKWSQLNDSDEKLCVAEFRPSAGYTNAAAVFNPEVWQCSSTSRLYNYDDVSFSLGSADQAINLKHWTTQHISEREPEDAEFDPSLNASQHALFISGMQGVHFASPRGLTSRRSQRNKVPSATPDFSQPSKLEERETLKRWSSCSTVYIGDGCLVHPDRNTTLWSVAVAVGLLIRSKRNYDLSSLVCSDEGNPKSGSISLCGETAQIYRDVYSVFDERTYPIGCYKSSSSDGRSNRLDFVDLPQFSEVHRFILGLFRTALLGPECAIVALIFLERLVNAAEVGVLPWSWRRQLLACILLASKILDDQAVWNTDYCQILRDVRVDDLNALERHTLSLLQFNIDVPPAVYVRYYFDLLSVGEASGVANRPADRRRLTPELARYFRIIPPQTSTNLLHSDGMNTGSGLLFDLPCRPDHTNAEVKKPKRDRKSPAISSGINPSRSSSVQHLDPAKPCPVVTTDHPAERAKSPADTRQTPPPASSRFASGTPFANPVINFTQADMDQSFDNWNLEDDADEGPLPLDEEAELINTLPATFDGPVMLAQSTQPATPHPHKPNQSTVPSTNPWNPCSSPLSKPAYSPWDTAVTSCSAQNPPPAVSGRSNQTCEQMRTTVHVPPSNGFIRSLMGGEVAYSLLRDAGIY